ncbi:hypothetical protein B0H11DRAFT_2017073 [Mycena galericulata]|nr:hypothetical protein B0H11DRAFT_2123047 [Mycena galericulata]KAJ7486135.1 hypothetical protein B0H11DRAFT_2017073 [Mycena galericulata]
MEGSSLVLDRWTREQHRATKLVRGMLTGRYHRGLRTQTRVTLLLRNAGRHRKRKISWVYEMISVSMRSWEGRHVRTVGVVGGGFCSGSKRVVGRWSWSMRRGAESFCRRQIRIIWSRQGGMHLTRGSWKFDLSDSMLFGTTSLRWRRLVFRI